VKGATNPLKCLPTDSKREISYPSIKDFNQHVTANTSFEARNPFPRSAPKALPNPPPPSHTPAPTYSPWPPHPGAPTTQRSSPNPAAYPKTGKKDAPLPVSINSAQKHFAFSYNGINRSERPFFYVHNCDRLRGVGRFWSALHEKMGRESVDFSRCVDEC
jgi:hypothetical protein